MADRQQSRLTKIIRGEDGEDPTFVGPVRGFGFGEEASITEELVSSRDADGRRHCEAGLILRTT